MKLQKTLIASLGVLLLLPGCGGNIIDWADETFYQSKMHDDLEKRIQPFLKGVRLYDQLETIAMFDAMWLSDTVRTAYSQVYARMSGKDEEGYIDFLRRELSANTYFVSFYVLSINTISLTTTPPEWAVHLEIDGKKYLPAEIKLAELPFEYIRFFGKRINNHRQPYEIRFDRKDTQGNDILADKKVMKLFFSSPRYFDVLSWNLDEDTKINLPPFNLKEEPKPTVTKHPAVQKKKMKKQRGGRLTDHSEKTAETGTTEEK